MRYIAHSAQRAHILLIIIIIRGILRFVFGYYYFIYFVFLPYIGWYGISWPLCACWLSKIIMHSCGYTSTQPELSHDAVSFDGSECVCWRGFNKFAYAHPMLCMNARTTHTHTQTSVHTAYGLFEFSVSNTRVCWTNFVLLFHWIKQAGEWANSTDRNNWLCFVSVCAFLFFFSSLQFGSLFPTGFNLCVHWASLFLHYPLGSTFCFVVFSGLHHFPQNANFFSSSSLVFS